MGGSVSSFVSNVAKKVAKGATSALGGMIPVVGPALAEGVNSLYNKGGKVMPRFEAGGVVPDGFKAKVLNTPADLIRTIQQFPAEAAKANRSVQDVKDAVSELKMGRGGMMADGGMVGGHMMPDGKMYFAMPPPKPAPLNPGRGQMGMMYGRGGEPALAMGGMSGQRMARGRGGF